MPDEQQKTVTLPDTMETTRGRDYIRSYKTKADLKCSTPEKIADALTSQFGTISFLIINILWFAGWILINTGHVSFIEPFDSYPFDFLTMIVSLEAILLSIIVLISQNRENKISSLRAEIDTHIDIVSEEEITKLLEIVTKIARKQGLNLSNDKQLKKMSKPVDHNYLQRKFEYEV